MKRLIRRLRLIDARIHLLRGFPAECQLVELDDFTVGLRPEKAAFRVKSNLDAHWERFSPFDEDRVVNIEVFPYVSGVFIWPVIGLFLVLRSIEKGSGWMAESIKAWIADVL